jgi:hypothetical protein
VEPVGEAIFGTDNNSKINTLGAKKVTWSGKLYRPRNKKCLNVFTLSDTDNKIKQDGDILSFSFMK